MTWDFGIHQYVYLHCVGRGLATKSTDAYHATLRQFQAYVLMRLGDKSPGEITPVDVLGYLEHLRRERDNGAAALNRQVTVLRNFYRALVSPDHLDPRDNPMRDFPRIKAKPRKLPVVLSEPETERLLTAPPTDTILGVRDRALLALLYGTGIRAAECAGLKEEDVDLVQEQIQVTGKGGHERIVPLNRWVVLALGQYRRVRGRVEDRTAFFLSRFGQALSRGAIYERVRTYALRTHLPKRMSPHRLRHTFATHLVKAGTRLPVIRDLLGHRLITSTQIYMHVTAQDLREAAAIHPIGRMAESIGGFLPQIRRPFQHPPRRMSG